MGLTVVKRPEVYRTVGIDPKPDGGYFGAVEWRRGEPRYLGHGELGFSPPALAALAPFLQPFPFAVALEDLADYLRSTARFRHVKQTAVATGRLLQLVAGATGHEPWLIPANAGRGQDSWRRRLTGYGTADQGLVDHFVYARLEGLPPGLRRAKHGHHRDALGLALAAGFSADVVPGRLLVWRDGVCRRWEGGA